MALILDLDASMSGICWQYDGAFDTSMMGELAFFLGLQIKQTPDQIFLNQEKYTKELFKKFEINGAKPIATSMSTTKLDKDEKGKDRPKL